MRKEIAFFRPPLIEYIYLLYKKMFAVKKKITIHSVCIINRCGDITKLIIQCRIFG